MDLPNLNRDRKSKKNSLDLSNFVYGKVPPQNKEVETAILGALMLPGSEDAYSVVSGILTPQAFYLEAHQRIFKAMVVLAGKHSPIDLLTVCEQLRVSAELEIVGGPFFVSKLTNAVVSTANLEAHCRIVLQKFIQRELIRVGGEMIATAYEDTTDVFEALNEAENAVLAINDHLSFGELVGMQKVLVQSLAQIDRSRELFEEHGHVPITGVSTGFSQLDLITLGWQPGDLIIIAARPAMGKTAFALHLARAAARSISKKVAMFSLEMKAARLVMRMLSAESEVFLTKLKSGALTDFDYRQLHSKGVATLSKMGILFNDNSSLNIRQLRAKTKKLAKKGELGLIIIDYLQLMKPEKGGNREQEISGISRELKEIAQEYNVPVIALSQLSREIEKRTNGVPMLSDLRESGAIEQDADQVLFLYGYSETQVNENADLKNRRFVKIAKNRDGLVETVEVTAELAIQNFSDLKEENSFPGNFRPVNNFYEPKESEAKLYIQKGSKMNDDLNGEMPF